MMGGGGGVLAEPTYSCGLLVDVAVIPLRVYLVYCLKDVLCRLELPIYVHHLFLDLVDRKELLESHGKKKTPHPPFIALGQPFNATYVVMGLDVDDPPTTTLLVDFEGEKKF